MYEAIAASSGWSEAMRAPENALARQTAKNQRTTMRIEARSKGRITIPDDQRVVLDHARLDGEELFGPNIMAIRLDWFSFACLQIRSNQNSVGGMRQR
jgi:hypothetical protein